MPKLEDCIAISVCILTSHAFADEWSIPKAIEPLRLNVGVIAPSNLKYTVQFQALSERSLFDRLPPIGTSTVSSEYIQKHAESLISFTQGDTVGIEWGALDAIGANSILMDVPLRDDTSILSTELSFCIPKKDEKLTSRSKAWDFAYQCIEGLASKSSKDGRPAIQAFLGDPAARHLHVIEPVLDLENEAFQIKYANISAQQFNVAKSGERMLEISPASKVWPSGEPGWHLIESQLAAAYQQQFPLGVETRATVVTAHLDTGYFPDDPRIPAYFDKEKSTTCEAGGCTARGGIANWNAKGILDSPGHGAATLSNFAGSFYEINPNQVLQMGGNPSALVFSVNIHDSFVHFDSRRMGRGIEESVVRGADLITLSHGGLPSDRLVSAVNSAYEKGTPIFAATGDFLEFPLFLGRTFSQVVYPARYGRVMGVAGVTNKQISYGDNPSLRWWFSFGSGYFSRLESWMVRGSFGPSYVMDKNIISTYVPNITRSISEPGRVNAIGHNGAGTSHATPQVAAAASIWLESNPISLKAEWRWQKTEAVYQALIASASRCYADYNILHEGEGILRARDALDWNFKSSEEGSGVIRNVHTGEEKPLTKKADVDLDLPGVVEIFLSARLPGQYSESLREALKNALLTELSQLIFTSERLQKFLQKTHLCEPKNGCDRCTRQDLDLDRLAAIVQTLPDASTTIKEVFRESKLH